MKIAIHQPNFCPWLPFFYKMAMADKFVLLTSVQFEKNGFQNRFKYKDKWITRPVENKTEIIYHKNYADGLRLYAHNYEWIKVIKDTLGIKTKIIFDTFIFQNFLSNRYNNKTQRLVDIVKASDGETYITNPEAKDKYLDEKLFADNAIDIEYCKVPKHLNKSIFEMFEEYGIEGTKKQLPKRR